MFQDCLVVAGVAKADGEFTMKEEVYIPALNKWQQILKHEQERVFNELVSCNVCLFAMGGNNMLQPLFSMEKLSDFDGEWEVVESMNERRLAFTAVNCEGEIFAIGGLTISDHSQNDKVMTINDTKEDKKDDNNNEEENSRNYSKNDKDRERKDSPLLSSSSSSIVSDDDDADDFVFKSVEKCNPVEKMVLCQ